MIFKSIIRKIFSVFGLLSPKSKKTKKTKNKYTVLEIGDSLYSKALKREVELVIYIPSSFYSDKDKVYPALLFNDGQDLKVMHMKETLQDVYKRKKLTQHITVGMVAGNRMQEYGTAHIIDYRNRGKNSQQHIDFIIKELLPFLQAKYKVSTKKYQHTIAGFSLGGLSALYTAWMNETQFRAIGVFSGSLWWRSEAFDPEQPDAHRIMHQIVEQSRKRKYLKLWFEAGTADETSDRNQNGTIDAIDDTLSLIHLLKEKGYTEEEVSYLEIENGQHNPDTWAKAMPHFLEWLGK